MTPLTVHTLNDSCSPSQSESTPAAPCLYLLLVLYTRYSTVTIKRVEVDGHSLKYRYLAGQFRDRPAAVTVVQRSRLRYVSMWHVPCCCAHLLDTRVFNSCDFAQCINEMNLDLILIKCVMGVECGVVLLQVYFVSVIVTVRFSARCTPVADSAVV